MTRSVNPIEITEKVWTAQIIQLAKTFGWDTYHPWLAVHSAPGWPDLALVRDCLVLAELKAEKGKLTAAQEKWIAALKAAGVEVYVWRPSQFDEIVEILKR